MNSRIIRPLAVAGLVLTAAAIGAAPASAETAAPVSGSVEVCAPIHLGPLELSFCL
ncbi:hypothetical protein IU485_02920 [Nocardia cyriacigeorgica]|uniref:Uncharacterized protein n=1 Tax=Nocardia cyriacigeorgica (strain GUH-2) TaxID=1127134 RepID=H6RCD9_NOCCG|nr:hypothetical protein [Nocardia cyriacigeorgica]MBF6080302.1 hypothetical protein [Nocardia cyriacigeorgica]MBF6287525.1 hypothetical protein [Nocardia cyriacigeorgica]MBF6423134.1 hypothetical protein [Nocardia cyriacigeorgica]CCF63879.1 conserved exported protein of unknown function [Nocardia cyriacigeorgica GUH-2]BDT87533.1 hypothetical protein FMUAM8_32970 [Nocardia cyriacigeorgica]